MPATLRRAGSIERLLDILPFCGPGAEHQELSSCPGRSAGRLSKLRKRTDVEPRARGSLVCDVMDAI